MTQEIALFTYSRLFWEALPLLAGLAATLICGHKALTTLTHSVRVRSIWAVICAVLLIVAQASWSWTLFVKGDLLGTDAANVVWTMFNTLVMAKFIYTAAKD